MRLQDILVVILGVTLVEKLIGADAQGTYQPVDANEFSASQILEGIGKLNAVRSKFAKQYGVPNMLKVQPHWDLMNADQRFIKDGGARWAYLDSAVPPACGEGHRLNYEDWNNNSTFINITRAYPGLTQALSGWHIERIHDTFDEVSSKSPSGTLQRAEGILTLRFQSQDQCFVLKNCTLGQFCNFLSCFNVASKSCDGGPQSYLGRAIYPAVEWAGLVDQHMPGRFANNPIQVNPKTGGSFEMPLIMDADDWPPLTNTPFETGKEVCSACPPTHSYCDDALCSVPPIVSTKASITIKPTRPPTEKPSKKPSLRAG